MTIIGSRLYPCRHHRVNPRQPHARQVRCDICKAVHAYIVEPSPWASKLSTETVWRIRWLEVAA